MKWVNFNLTHFIPQSKNMWKYHYFYFLARYFFAYDDFPGWFTKNDFIKAGKDKKFSVKKLSWIWKHGHKKENPFLDFVSVKDGNDFTRLKSYRTIWDGRTVRITKETIFKSIKSLPDFKLLCYAIVSARPSKGNVDDIEKMESKKQNIFYVRLVRSRTLSTIWETFFWWSKTATSKILTKAKDKFSFFHISKRFTTYNWKIMRISNLYSMNGIEYHFSKNKWNKVKIDRFLSDWNDEVRTIKTRVIRKERFIFWNKINITKEMRENKEIFIDRDLYQDIYLWIIWK